MKKLLILVAVIAAGYLYFNGQHGIDLQKLRAPVSGKSSVTPDSVIADAYANHKSNLRVSGEGVVTRLLPDDNKVSRHQKFIIALASGQTLLVAHNIDTAPRIKDLSRLYSVASRAGLIYST